MSTEDNLHCDELGHVIKSLQTWSIEDKQREILESKMDNIIRGFSVPYAPMVYRRGLKKIVTSIIDDDSTKWKIKPSEDLKLRCVDIMSQLSSINAFANSKTYIDKPTRTKIKDLMADVKSFILISLNDDIISRIKLPRNQSIDDIITESIPSDVQYCVMFTSKDITDVYISKLELIDELCSHMNKLMTERGIHGIIEVKYAENGSIFKNIRLENPTDFLVSGGPIARLPAGADNTFPKSGTVGTIVALQHND